jgi:hypothetical protein
MKKSRKWEKILTLAITLCLVSSFPLINADDYDPMADTEMTMTPQSVDVGDTESFTVSINVYPTELIDAVATDLITFDPSIIACSNISFGNFFTDGTIQIDGTIDNINGTITYMCWGAINETNENGTFVNITFDALAQGQTYIIINESEAGAAYAGNHVPMNITNNVTVNVTSYVPGPPAGFTATPVNRTAIQVDWTKATKADYTWIEWNTISSWSRGAGNFISNTTGTTITDNSLDPGETRYYRGWSYNTTGNNWSTTSAMDSATSTDNIAPILSNEYPVNGTTIEVFGNIDWSIDINDTEGDVFNWSIECSDGTNDSENNNANETASYTIYNTTYGETYTLWVNVTDGYDWTREWFIVAMRNQYISDPPTDFLATKINLTAINLTWTKNLTADSTYIEVNDEATWVFGNGTEIYNGTGEQFTYDGLSPDHYYFQAWSYNATDGTYSTTYAEDDVLTGVNDPPIQSTEDPTHQSTDIDIMRSTINISLYDNQSDLIIYTIESTYANDVSSSGGNGTYAANLNTPLPYSTTIYWYVNATDGFDWTNRTYWFTTRDQYEPDPPSGVEVTTFGSDQINISWILPSNADKVVVETNATGSWMELYNDSGSEFTHNGLDGHTTYYYRISAYNTTDGTRSTYVFEYNITDNNAPTGNNGSAYTAFTIDDEPDYTSVYDVHLLLNVSDPDGDAVDIEFYWDDGTPLGFLGSVSSGSEVSFNLSQYNNNLSTWYNTSSGLWEPRNFLNHSNQKNITGHEIGEDEIQTYVWYAIIDDGFDSIQTENYSFNTSAAIDIYENGRVFTIDVSMLVNSYGQRCDPGGEIKSDINNNGRVFAGDVSQLVNYYGKWYHT